MPNKKNSGFTLLEVMLAMSIIAIALVAVFGMQSQSLSLFSEAKFYTTASLLAQVKIAEIEAEKPDELVSRSGDFGDDFSEYFWETKVSNVIFPGAEDISEYIKQIDLKLNYGEQDIYQYSVRFYRFFPKK